MKNCSILIIYFRSLNDLLIFLLILILMMEPKSNYCQYLKAWWIVNYWNQDRWFPSIKAVSNHKGCMIYIYYKFLLKNYVLKMKDKHLNLISSVPQSIQVFNILRFSLSNLSQSFLDKLIKKSRLCNYYFTSTF